MSEDRGELSLVMSGGGARAAYQVGFLKRVADSYPDLEVPIVTGVSAGALNAAYLANHDGSFKHKVDELVTLWSNLRAENVFSVEFIPTMLNVARWGLRLLLGRASHTIHTRSLLDASPLQAFIGGALDAEGNALPGIRRNIDNGTLKAFAITGSSYSTGESVTWVQGREISMWDRAHRKSVHCDLTLNHILASASLPFFFPAIRIDGNWYGDGGIRMTAPLSPAIHLGARRILAISTRHLPESQEERQVIDGYPPPAQIGGALFNAIFLDAFDGDALRLERINSLIAQLPQGQHENLRSVDMMLLRPSEDLGKLANAYEAQLPPTFRFMERGLGTAETRSNDMLSLLMFQPDYLTRLIELGYHDADANSARLHQVLGPVDN